eukprot:gb/GECG01003031.1/.p1 GENE.gb/GECG01003031.1/~~gb/GECG01003031.1/.p1  ORF type:complete len:586 (+),score=83.26 gb/GECG01003031.1/:1-1758(+)
MNTDTWSSCSYEDLPIVDFDKCAEQASVSRGEYDYAGALEFLLILYAEGITRLRSFLEAVHAFANHQSLTVDVETRGTEGNDSHWDSHPIEKAIGDHTHAIAGSASNTAVWRVAKAAKEVSNQIKEHITRMQNKTGQHEFHTVQDREITSTRINFLSTLLENGWFHELKDRFYEFTKYLETDVAQKVQVDQSCTEDEIKELLEESGDVNGASLVQWRKHAGTRHFQQFLADVLDIPRTLRRRYETPNSRLDGESIVNSIPYDAVANDRSDNTYGIPGWEWPPDRPEEQKLRGVKVDKFPDNDVSRMVEQSDWNWSELTEMLITHYHEGIQHVRNVTRAASAFREDGKLSVLTEDGQRENIESAIKASAHAIKGSSGSLGLLKMWKIAKLIELPNKAFWERLSPEESHFPPEEERRIFLNKFTHCPNLLFFWVQFRNIAILLKEVIPQYTDVPMDELLANMGEELDGKDEYGVSYAQLYEQVSTAHFDSQFDDIIIYNPFGPSYYPPSSSSRNESRGEERSNETTSPRLGGSNPEPNEETHSEIHGIYPQGTEESGRGRFEKDRRPKEPPSPSQKPADVGCHCQVL